jgi:tetratricopeptide (TPR) repeat protein
MNTILRSTVFFDKSRKIKIMQNIIHHIFKSVLILCVLIIGNSKVVSANEKIESLYSELKKSKTESAARAIEEKIWQNWIIGPNAEVTTLLAKAMERRRAYDFAGSLEILNKVVEKTPNWAEVWNQRAFVHFLREEFDKSLEDADRAIELEPNHFGALAGKAQILMSRGRTELGQKALRKAIKLHPFLKERALLIEIPGQEL